MTAPIYIPTKGRWETCRTAKDLMAEGVEPILVVEKSEMAAYASAWELPMLMLPENDKGPWYARQAILRDARSRGLTWHWQLDDDLAGLATRNPSIPDSRYANVSWKAGLEMMELNVNLYPSVALAGPVQTQFGWAADKPWRFNTRVNAAMLIASSARAKFREEPMLKEDWDFCLQVLTNQQDTMLFQAIGVKTTQGQGKGGCAPLYAAGMGTKAAYRLAALWPDYVTVVEKFGRIDNKIDFKSFKRTVYAREVLEVEA